MHSFDPDRGAWASVVSIALLILLTGCESEIPSAPPPPPPPTVGSADDGLRSDSRAVAFIMPHPRGEPAEISLWEQAIRQEGNRNKKIVEVAQPGEKDPPNRQGDLIRDAANRGVTGLVVVPDPESGEALVEARDKGARVVLVDHSVDHKGKMFPLVAFERPAKSAEVLVDAVIVAAKEFELSPKGPALIVQHPMGDLHSKGRADALEAALKKANVEVLPRVQFNDPLKDLKPQILKAIAAHPKLPMVLIADDDAVGPIIEMRNDMYSADRFAFAAYGTESKHRKMVMAGQCAAVADVNSPRLARKALQSLMEILAGKTLPDRIEVEMPVTRPKRNDNTYTMPVPKPSGRNL
jgi:ABC-type sugar transport system substrate-binding protein